MHCILTYDISNFTLITKNDYTAFESNKLNKFVFITLLKHNLRSVKNSCSLIKMVTIDVIICSMLTELG